MNITRNIWKPQGNWAAISRRLPEWLGFGEKRCACCGTTFFGGNDSLCASCHKQLEPYQGPVCRLCGLPATADIEAAPKTAAKRSLCQECSKTPPVWDSLAFHGLYAGPLRDLILRLKFDGALHIASLLAGFLCEASHCLPAPDAIAAIPQHPSHLLKRGYNQAHELAAQLGRMTGLPVRTDILARIKTGLAQEALTARERRQNLENAFLASPKVRRLTIWLVDDVLTTGSTCSSAVLALKQAGAKSAHVLVAARTPLEQIA